MNRTLTSLVLTSVITAFGATALKAQTLASADIPFAFHAQSQVLPAGHYEIRRATDVSLGGTLSMRDRSGHGRFLTSTPGNNSNPQDPKLVFTVSNGEYTLRRVDLPGATTSNTITPSKSSYKVSLEPLVVVRLSH